MATSRAFKQAVSMMALATAITLTGCQKEELMENQFNEPQAVLSPLNGQAIEGQYIVVLKNGNTSISSNSTSQNFTTSKVAAARMRDNAIRTSGVKQQEIGRAHV